MDTATKHKNKLLLLGVLVALASMAVSMDALGFHYSRIEGSSALAMAAELKTGSQLAVEANSSFLKDEIFKVSIETESGGFRIEKVEQ